MNDLIPLIPDASLLGLLGAPAVKRIWAYWRKPAFWPEVREIRVKDKYDRYTRKQSYKMQDWIVVRRKARHRFLPVEGFDYKFSSPKQKYVKIKMLREEGVDKVDVDSLTDATTSAKRYANALGKRELEPSMTERAQKLLAS